jgi:hypothetical protein
LTAAPEAPAAGSMRAIPRPPRVTTKVSPSCSTASSSDEKPRAASVAVISFTGIRLSDRTDSAVTADRPDRAGRRAAPPRRAPARRAWHRSRCRRSRGRKWQVNQLRSTTVGPLRIGLVNCSGGTPCSCTHPPLTPAARPHLLWPISRMVPPPPQPVDADASERKPLRITSCIDRFDPPCSPIGRRRNSSPSARRRHEL